MQLENKKIIVTGGTKGIGSGIVRSMAAEEAIVICVNRPGPEGPAMEHELAAKGQRMEYIAADLTDVAQCKMVIDRTLEKYG